MSFNSDYDSTLTAKTANFDVTAYRTLQIDGKIITSVDGKANSPWGKIDLVNATNNAVTNLATISGHGTKVIPVSTNISAYTGNYYLLFSGNPNYDFLNFYMNSAVLKP